MIDYIVNKLHCIFERNLLLSIEEEEYNKCVDISNMIQELYSYNVLDRLINEYS